VGVGNLRAAGCGLQAVKLRATSAGKHEVKLRAMFCGHGKMQANSAGDIF